MTTSGSRTCGASRGIIESISALGRADPLTEGVLPLTWSASHAQGIAGLASLVSDLAEKRMKEPSAIPRYPHIGFSVAVRDDLAAVTERAPGDARATQGSLRSVVMIIGPRQRGLTTSCSLTAKEEIKTMVTMEGD